MSKKINIYGELYNDTPEGYVTSSDQIVDRISGKSQEVINNTPKTMFLVCNTPGDVSEKTIDLSGYLLEENVRLIIKLTYHNTSENPTLNINNTGAKIMSGNLGEGDDEILDVFYDGEKYICIPYTTILNKLENIINFLGQDYNNWLNNHL